MVAICTARSPPRAGVARPRRRHVFCEKPLAEDLAVADEIVRAAEEAGRLVVVNNQFPYMRIHRAAREMIGEPEFGRLLYLHAWQTVRPAVGGEPGWRGWSKRRLTFEAWGPRLRADPVLLRREAARTWRMPRSRGGADAVSLIALEFADGRAASVLLDRLSHAPQRYLEMRLDGERATVHLARRGGALRGRAAYDRAPPLRQSLRQGREAVWLRNGRSRVLAKEGINPLAAATATHFDNFVTAIERGDAPGDGTGQPADARAGARGLRGRRVWPGSGNSPRMIRMRRIDADQVSAARSVRRPRLRRGSIPLPGLPEGISAAVRHSVSASGTPTSRTRASSPPRPRSSSRSWCDFITGEVVYPEDGSSGACALALAEKGANLDEIAALSGGRLGRTRGDASRVRGGLAPRRARTLRARSRDRHRARLAGHGGGGDRRAGLEIPLACAGAEHLPFGRVVRPDPRAGRARAR